MNENIYSQEDVERLFRQTPKEIIPLYEKLPNPTDYPYIAYYAATQYATLGNIHRAYDAYNIALEGYEGDVFGTNRALLGIAHLAQREGDYEYCEELVKKVLNSAKDPVHIMAAWRYKAEVHRARGESNEENQAYQKALMYARRARSDQDISPERRQLVIQDYLLLMQKLSDFSVSRGMIDLAMINQQEVVRLTDVIKTSMPQYTVYAYIKQAQLFELRGDLETAVDYTRCAQDLAKRDERKDLHTVARTLEMRLLGKMGQDDRAKGILTSLETEPLAHQDIFMLLIEKARQCIYLQELEQAEKLIQELWSIRTEDTNIQFRIKILDTALACMRNDTRGKTYQAQLEAAIRFFEERHYLLDASEARLILAWALATERRTKAAKEYLAQCAEECRKLGHVSHIWRWYMLSLRRLGHLWWLVDTDMPDRVEAYAQEAPATRIQHARFYAFGFPRLMVNGENHLKQIREGTKHAPLLILFAEDKSLVLNEILDAIWEDRDNPRASFHQLRHKNAMIQELILHDAQSLIYSLNEEAFSYVDVWHFRKLIEEAYNENDPTTRMMYYRVALRLSEEPLAKGIEHPYIEKKREEYSLLRAQAIKTVLELRDLLRREMVKMPIPIEWGLELKQARERFGQISGFD